MNVKVNQLKAGKSGAYKAITGNDLNYGRVVYLDADNQWTQDLKDAAIFPADEAEAVLEAAQARVREITEVYVIDVEQDAVPTGRAALREEIRSAGPTVREDLGKQAGNL